MKIVIFGSFAVGENHLGKAVFAAREFKTGDVITQFKGDVYLKHLVPKNYEGEDDRYFQIGVHKFMGASNSVDDLMNHSCDPNGGLKFTPYGIFLIALKKVEVGDEITWDYSTTMYKNDWIMKCRCGTNLCRKEVGEFLKMPKRRQKFYLTRGVVAPYIVRAIKRATEQSGTQKVHTHTEKPKRRKTSAMLSFVR